MTQDDLSGSARTPSGSSGGPMSERMQALLARAAEDQLSEQRAVSAVLTELRHLVTGLGERLGQTASAAQLQGLGGNVTGLAQELRTSTAGLGSRLEELGGRVDAQAGATSELVSGSTARTEALADRVSALTSDLAEQRTALDRLASSVSALSELPRAVASVQQELAGLGAAVAPLDEVRTAVAELAQRTQSLPVLTTGLADVRRQLDGVATTADLVATREALTAEVTERLGRLDDLATSAELAQVRHATSAELGQTRQELTAEVSQRLAALDGLASSAELAQTRQATSDELLQTRQALAAEVAERLRALEGLATSAELAQTRQALSAETAERLSGVAAAAAARPVVTPDGLQEALVPVLARLDEVGRGAPVVAGLVNLDARVDVLLERLDGLAERLASVGEVAGGVPAVASQVTRLAARVDELGRLTEDVAGVRAGVSALQESPELPSLVEGISSLRQEVDGLRGRVSQVPTADVVSDAVTQQVTERLVDELAPRVAELVLSRVAGTLVDQVSARVTTDVQSGLTEQVREAGVDSERRISAHVDEAVLALAEALLRRRRNGRGTTSSLLAGWGDADDPGVAQEALEAPLEELEEALEAAPNGVGSDAPAQTESSALLDEPALARHDSALYRSSADALDEDGVIELEGGETVAVGAAPSSGDGGRAEDEPLGTGDLDPGAAPDDLDDDLALNDDLAGAQAAADVRDEESPDAGIRDADVPDAADDEDAAALTPAAGVQGDDPAADDRAVDERDLPADDAADAREVTDGDAPPGMTGDAADDATADDATADSVIESPVTTQTGSDAEVPAGEGPDVSGLPSAPPQGADREGLGVLPVETPVDEPALYEAGVELSVADEDAPDEDTPEGDVPDEEAGPSAGPLDKISAHPGDGPGDGLDAEQAPSAASDPTGDAAPLIDSAPAPVPSRGGYTSTSSRSMLAAASAASAPAAESDEYDDDDEDDEDEGPRRRPWWRPGG